MSDKITSFIKNIDFEDYKEFESKTNSSFEHNRKTENSSRDFSWIPVLEEALPFIDNIIRNPKRFLEQEEDIVIVEKSKKISTETIRHLAQHTNFIQDVDEEGMVKPSKVLNIEKEDTWDLYENRFIYTLIKELVKFIKNYTDKDLEKPQFLVTNNVNYIAQTSYKNENVKIDLNIETIKSEDSKLFDIEDMKKRMLNIQSIIIDYENSSFMKSLSQASPVHSPIRKTNTILNDPNFRKALEVWEYIKNSEIGIFTDDVSTQNEIINDINTKENFDFTFFLDYISINKLKNENDADSNALADKLISLLEEYIDISNISEKKLTTFIMNEIRGAIKKRRNRDLEIEKIYNDFINEQNQYIDYIYEMI